VRTLVGLTLALIAPLALAACDGNGASEQGQSCAEAIRTAALEIEVDRQLRGLDAALPRCSTYADYLAGLRANPGVVGYSPETYIELRCGNVTEPRLRFSPTCRSAVPPTTPPESAAPLVYSAATLDGRVIELAPSPEVPFAGEVPVVIQETVDIATVQGCRGVLAQRDEYLAQAADDDFASVYAQHAINVAVWIGCDGAQPGATDATTAPTTAG